MSVCMGVSGSRRSRSILLALVALLLAPVPVHAQESPQPVTMVVEAGIAGYVDPNSPMSVRVDVSAQQLFIGRIDVRANRQTSSVDIEVPAGSTKRYVLETTPMGRSRQVTVSIARGQENALLTENVRVRVPANEILIALAGVTSIEATVRSAVSTPVGRELTPLTVDLPSTTGSLAAVSYLVVGAGDLADLDAGRRNELDTWIRRGGRIVGPAAEVAELGAPLGDALPGADAVAAVLGAGEVISVTDLETLTVEDWSSIVRDVAPKGLVYDQSQEASGATLLSAASAGREAQVPALPWLLLGILLFVVLVGPVNFLVLRWMGKPEAAWLTVPALSLLFVAAFWFIGRSQLNDFTVDQATVVVEEFGKASASTALVMQAATEGVHEMALPEGWQPEPFESLGLLTATTTRVEDGRTVLAFEMQDLGVGVAQASLPFDRLDIDVVMEPESANTLNGTVTNNSGVEFWAWGVVLNGRANRGDESLAAGATAALVVRPRGGIVQYEPVIATGVIRSFNSPARDQNTYVAVDALARHAETMSSELREPGAYFFGFTDELAPTVTVDGRSARTVGTTLVVQQLDIDPTLLVQIGRARPELLSVTGASSLESWYGEIYAYGADQMVLGYRVPEGVPNFAKIGTTSRQFSVVEAYDWGLDEFVPIEWNTDFSLPRFTSVTGDVVVRASVDPERDNEFFGDESIVLDRYALVWSTS